LNSSARETGKKTGIGGVGYVDGVGVEVQTHEAVLVALAEDSNGGLVVVGRHVDC
jgi:hypothetical protein